MKKIEKEILKKQKRRKISILNILIIMLTFSLLFLMLFKNKENIQKMLPKIKRQKAEQSYSASDLKIGDIVYYNHKIPEDKANEDKLKVTFEKGNAEVPGTGKEETQTFDSRNHKVLWKVWDIKPNGEVVIVSDKDYTLGTTYGAIGHIWWEHNMHKGASTFGYGYGANTDKIFEYKVGSGLENTGDTAKWKTGINGIPKSGTRALTLGDVEEKLGIIDAKIKAGENGIEHNYGVGYGNIAKLNISFPQRKVKGLNQKWEDEVNAKAAKQDVEAKNSYYIWKWENVPDSKYKDLTKRNSYFYLATNTLGSYSSWVNFHHGLVGSRALSSAGNYLVDANSASSWIEYASNFYPRFATFLKSNITYYKAPNEENAWDIVKLEAREKNLELKVTNLTEKNENIEYTFKSDLPASHGRSDPAPEVLVVLGKKEVTKNAKVNIYSGQIRTGKLIDAEFTEVHNKYKIEIKGLPSNSTYKIIGADSSGYIDLSKVSSIEAIIYPKNGDYTVPIEYVGGENDTSFEVSGTLKLMNGKDVVKSKSVNLKRGVLNITFSDVSMFNTNTNKLNEYTVVFEKNNGIHKVELLDGKITVTYVPEKLDIKIQAKSEGKITLASVTVDFIKKVDGKEEVLKEVELLSTNNFTENIKVDKTDKSGKIIEYSIKKKSLNMGYVTSINGFDINLKPVIKLPFTGENINYKTIGITFGAFVSLALIFRYRKKLVLIFKEYTIMK